MIVVHSSFGVKSLPYLEFVEFFPHIILFLHFF